MTRAGELQITAQGEQSIDDKSWRENLDIAVELTKTHGPVTGVLVWTMKHAPTANQRKILAEEYASLIAPQRRLAIVTESIIVRGTATAVGWLSGGAIKTRGFAPYEIDDCLRWLADVSRFDPQQARDALDAVLEAVHLTAPRRAAGKRS